MQDCVGLIALPLLFAHDAWLRLIGSRATCPRCRGLKIQNTGTAGVFAPCCHCKGKGYVKP